MVRPQEIYQRILDGMANEAAIPQLPTSCLQVLKLIGIEEPNLTDIHHAILASPALTTSVLRMASSAFYNRQSRAVSDVRTAIQILGLKTLRSITFAVMVQSTFSNSARHSGLNVHRFVRHSMFVGLLASSLFQVHRTPETSRDESEPDELFAAGVLHDVGIGILSVIEPGVFRPLAQFAEQRELTFSEAFASAFGSPTVELTTIALKTWGISDRLVNVVSSAFSDTSTPRNLSASCLRYADYLLESQGLGLLSQRAAPACPEDVIASAGISEEEGRSAVHALSETCDLWMAGSGSTPL
ncbi:MAG: HDOD domain-containing protein [Fimbriimonadaceae bacterium]|nr:HDOD domain-containing protein [Fimbriimonadaceae bacterium]